MEDWRSILYPLGFVANVLFAARFFMQWISSEKKSFSHFSLSFWLISLFGSLLLAVHSFIQVQYPICLIQTCNVILYWRNWELTSYPRSCLISLQKVSLLLAFLTVSMTLSFMAVSYFTLGTIEWMRVPDFIEQHPHPISLTWNIIGFFGTFLFASRFWFHWWRAENNYKNALNSHFWILSVVGSLFALAYFIRIADIVNIIGYSAGLIPYLRNLFLIRKANQLVKADPT